MATGCGGEQRADAVATADVSPVYRLTPDALPPGECEDPSCTLVRLVIWVAPEPGWSRSETEDGTGFQTTSIYAHDTVVRDHNDGPPDIRSGIASFVGGSPDGEIVDAVRTSGTLAAGDRIGVRYAGTTVEFVVREVLDFASAAARELFAIPEGGIRSRTLEPGTPSDSIVGYWLGPRYGDRQAVTAVERDTPTEDGYFVSYGEGPGSAGTLQIASGPAGQAGALDGKEQRRVTLADGERARLIAVSPADGSYVVVTRTAVVGFTADSGTEAVRIAEALRPLGPP
jgi:hypothetical protein